MKVVFSRQLGHINTLVAAKHQCIKIIIENLIWNYIAENAPGTDKRDLLSELEIMKQLKPHPHVIRLLGCVTESGKYWT